MKPKGNFFRDTLHPEKHCSGVSLQQGVPRVDADWNEMHKMVRHPIYSGFADSFGDVVAVRAAVLKVFGVRQHDLSAHGGQAVVSSR